MEPQLHHTHGRHYDGDATTANLNAATTGHDLDEDEHHGEKKSVIKKVKEKAKKLKNTITKHGHSHDDHHHHQDEDDDDDEEEEMEVDPEVHGAPMYDSARAGPDAILSQPRGNLERPSVLAEDRYPTSEARHVAPPPVSTGPYGANLTQPVYHQEMNPNQLRGNIGESNFPNQTYGQDVNVENLRGNIGNSTGMVKDPHGPNDPSWAGSDPSNYETKVTNPTHKGGKEAELSQIQHSFGKMGIHDEEPKRFDPNHPENLPHDTLDTGSENQSSHGTTYVEKISSSASAIADKATDMISSTLGYQTPHTVSHQTTTTTAEKSGTGATDYAHKITEKVTETLAPVYEKVVDAGTSVMSKVHGTGSAVATGGGGDDKGVSVKEYLAETLRPGEEDKALSEVITHAFHRNEESEKKSAAEALGRVTESEEVRRRLGSDHQHQQRDSSGNVVAEKGVADRLKDAVGSWFGGQGNAPQGTLGTSYVSDQGLSTSPTGGTGERNGGRQ